MAVLLRIPSLIGMLLSCHFLYRLSEDMLGKGAGLLLSRRRWEPDRDPARGGSTPLRAGACGLPRFAAGLHTWLSTGRRRDWLLLVFCAAAIFYLHYIFAVFYVVLRFYVFLRVSRTRVIPWRGLLSATVAILVLVLPLAPDMYNFVTHSKGLSYLRLPDPLDLALACVPSTAFLPALVAVFVHFMSYRTAPPALARSR